MNNILNKLNYKIDSPIERNELLHNIIAEIEEPELLTPSILDKMSDYLIYAMDKEERKKRKILTENRLLTIKKHEVSYQGLAESFEGGEDTLHNLFIENEKSYPFSPRTPITKKEIEEISDLKEICKSIDSLKKLLSRSSGRKKYIIKKQIIDLYKDQYIVRASSKKQMFFLTNTVKAFNNLNLDETIEIDLPSAHLKSNCFVSLFNPTHISMLLVNYSKLKKECYGKFWTDSYYLLEDLDNLIEDTLKDKYPLLYDLLIYKIDGKPNKEIAEILEQDYGEIHSVEYYSTVWRKRIPKLLAENARIKYFEWYYTNKERGVWKKCSRCGKIKLMNNIFFSKNKASKTGYYSACKDCRNHKADTKKKGDDNYCQMKKI